MIKVLYFASLREHLKQTSEQMELPNDISTVGELRQRLAKRGGLWLQLFDPEALVMMSVNQAISENKTAIKDGDEIAFFPPVTGG
jgi:molybdopterin synthase sulfur carrier subunit